MRTNQLFCVAVTKDKEKLQNLNDAMKIFEDWLKEFENKNKSKENRPYLPLDAIKVLLPLKDKYAIKDEKALAFIKAYEKVKGEYKNLRTVDSGDGEPTWDIVRNTNLKKLVKEQEEGNADLWNDDLPSKEHMKLILWAYSPQASNIKKNKDKFEEILGSKSESSDEEEMEEDEGGKKNSSKRKSESSDSDDESPKKKSKK